jgi:hypothetical protein
MIVDVVPWAREALGVKSLAEAVQELREDEEYMERLNRRLEEDRPVLEALRRSEEEDRKQKKSENEGQ